MFCVSLMSILLNYYAIVKITNNFPKTQPLKKRKYKLMNHIYRLPVYTGSISVKNNFLIQQVINIYT